MEKEIFGEVFLTVIFFLLIIGYPLSEKKFWAKDDLVWSGFSLNIPERKCGIFDVKRRFALEKVQLLKGIKEPSLNQVQSVEGPLQWVSQMCPWLRPFLAGLYAFFENKKLSVKTGKKSSTILNTPAFRNAKIFSPKSFKNRNLHRRLCKISFRKGNDKLGLWRRYRGNSRNKRESSRIPPTGSKRKNSPVVKRDKVATQTH